MKRRLCMNIKNIIAAVCVISVGLSNSTAMAVMPTFTFEAIALLASGSVGATLGAALGAKKGAALGRQYGQWMWPAGGAAVGIVAGGIAGAISGIIGYEVIINVREKVRKSIEAMRKKSEALREKFTK